MTTQKGVILSEAQRSRRICSCFSGVPGKRSFQIADHTPELFENVFVCNYDLNLWTLETQQQSNELKESSQTCDGSILHSNSLVAAVIVTGSDLHCQLVNWKTAKKS